MPVARVTLDASAVTLAEGEAATVVATALDADGRPVPGRAVHWTSSDPDVAAVSADGRIDAIRAGTARVVATVEERTAEAAVAVHGLPGLEHDLVYDLTRGLPGVGPEPFALDVHVAGARPHALLAQPGAWDVAPSPDGERLAFTVAAGGRTEIGVTRRDGSGLVIVAGGSGGSDQPAWSPDGTRLAFRRWAPGGPPGPFNPAAIWVVRADGTGLARLAGDSAASLASPTWSARLPDGGYRVAYSRQFRAGGYLTGRIRSIRDDGTDERSETAAGEWLDTEPAWSPDGRRIAFVRTGGEAAGDLWVVDADGGAAARPLLAADPPGEQRSPAWSPDGRLLAFTSAHEADARGAYHQVCTVWPDGTRLARRTFDPLDKAWPAWLRRAP